MTKERSLKLLLLTRFINNVPLEELKDSTYCLDDKVYDMNKIVSDFDKLQKEFLEPYAIN